MIVTVTPNPALDLTYHVEELIPGDSHRVLPARVRAGGKGVNVARVAHQAGAAVIAVATSGGYTGDVFQAELIASGVPHRFVAVAAETRRSVTIVDTTGGASTIFNERGGTLSHPEWTQVLATAAQLAATSRCLVGSGSLPPGAPDDFYARLVGIARDVGIPSVIDATGPGLLAAARAGASVLKPNQRELEVSTGGSDPVRGASLLLDAGAGLVLVSLGAAGMLAVTAATRAHPLRARLRQPLVGNPTGAGDAAVAAVAVALADGETSPEVLLRRATAWSAAAVLSPVAGELECNYAEMESRLVIDRC
jgi:1-phosphofructokinase family hexose kinase